MKTKQEELLIEVEKIRNSVQYQIGDAIIKAVKPSKKTLFLPIDLYKIIRNHKQNNLKTNKTNLEFNNLVKNKIYHKYTDDEINNIDDISELLDKYNLEVGKTENRFNLGRKLIRKYKDQGDLSNVVLMTTDLMKVYPHNQFLYREYSIALDKLRILNGDDNFYIITKKAYEKPSNNKILNVLNVSLPYRYNGYSIRSDYLIKQQKNYGFEPVIITRAGFPNDFGEIVLKYNSKLLKETHEEDIYYRCFPNLLLRHTKISEYIKNFTLAIIKVINDEDISIVHSASNYVIGLSGLLAARATNKPFVYEVRGFWELTTASSVSEFYNSEEFQLTQKLETYICEQADKVITISNELKKELITRGVDENKISIIPNGIDSKVIKPVEKNQSLIKKYNLNDKFVIGYIGSIVYYEGLDKIIRVIKILRDEGINNIVFIVVGTGKYLDELRSSVEKLQLTKQVIFVGRINHSQVNEYYSLFDLCIFPRIDTDVTNIVPPLKPVEAMATSKLVMVSDLPAIKEVVIDGVNGIVSDGSINDIKEKIIDIYYNFDNYQTIIDNTRSWIKNNREWEKVCEKIMEIYRF